MTNWNQIQSTCSWIRIQEKRDGFGFSCIRIQSAWIRMWIRYVQIRTSLVHTPMGTGSGLQRKVKKLVYNLRILDIHDFISDIVLLHTKNKAVSLKVANSVSL